MDGNRQSEGKLDEAEEQCYQATITFPEDGETLMLYAQLVWELHHDQAKASSYFERAALVAPNNRLNSFGSRVMKLLPAFFIELIKCILHF